MLAASCMRKPTRRHAGQDRKRARRPRRGHGDGAARRRSAGARDFARSDSDFWHWADAVGVDAEPLPGGRALDADPSHPAMRVNLDACIQCGLCVRACREVQVNDVIGMAYRNATAKIVFDFDDPMGASTCVACGECVQACPTGALMPAAYLDDAPEAHGLARPQGRFALPLLRRRLPGHLSGRGTTASSTGRAAMGRRTTIGSA